MRIAFKKEGQIDSRTLVNDFIETENPAQFVTLTKENQWESFRDDGRPVAIEITVNGNPLGFEYFADYRVGHEAKDGSHYLLAWNGEKPQIQPIAPDIHPPGFAGVVRQMGGDIAEWNEALKAQGLKVCEIGGYWTDEKVKNLLRMTLEFKRANHAGQRGYIQQGRDRHLKPSNPQTHEIDN